MHFFCNCEPVLKEYLSKYKTSRLKLNTERNYHMDLFHGIKLLQRELSFINSLLEIWILLINFFLKFADKIHMSLKELESPRSHIGMGMERGLKTMQINATGDDEILIMLFCLPNCSSLENSAVKRQAVYTQMLWIQHPFSAPKWVETKYKRR